LFKSVDFIAASMTWECQRPAELRPTEFGVVVKVQEAEGGIVTDIGVDEARSDSGLLLPSVEIHKTLFGRVPALVATDRGFFPGGAHWESARREDVARPWRTRS
jgi:hypothetical protein